MNNMQISCQKQQLRTIHEHLASPLVFGWIHVDHMFCFLYCVFCSVCLNYVSFAQCWLCLWIDHSWLTLQFSLTFTDLEYLNDQRYIFYALPNTGAYIIRIFTLLIMSIYVFVLFLTSCSLSFKYVMMSAAYLDYVLLWIAGCIVLPSYHT
jgi:hypothetical protein